MSNSDCMSDLCVPARDWESGLRGLRLWPGCLWPVCFCQLLSAPRLTSNQKAHPAWGVCLWPGPPGRLAGPSPSPGVAEARANSGTDTRPLRGRGQSPPGTGPQTQVPGSGPRCCFRWNERPLLLHLKNHTQTRQFHEGVSGCKNSPGVTLLPLTAIPPPHQ